MPPPRPLQHLADERAALRESLHGPITLQDRLEGGDEPSYLRAGLASSVLRDLRRGRWVIQDEIDLHGLNREQAREVLAGFLAVKVAGKAVCIQAQFLRQLDQCCIIRRIHRPQIIGTLDGQNHGFFCLLGGSGQNCTTGWPG